MGAEFAGAEQRRALSRLAAARDGGSGAEPDEVAHVIGESSRQDWPAHGGPRQANSNAIIQRDVSLAPENKTAASFEPSATDPRERPHDGRSIAFAKCRGGPLKPE